MEPFDWDIGQKSSRWTSEAVARRLCPIPATIDDPEGLVRSEHEQLTLLAGLLETLGLEKAVRLGKLEDWKAALVALEKQRAQRGIPRERSEYLRKISSPLP